MAHLLPMLALGIPAALSGISGIMDIVSSAQKLRGGRLKKYKKAKAIRKKKTGGAVMRKRGRRGYRKGKGMAADIATAIPLFGSLLGPLVKSFGGRIQYKKRQPRMIKGRGLAPLDYPRPYSANVGHGMLYAPGGQKRYGGSLLSGLIKGAIQSGMAGHGLLSPAGGKIRRGHYRYVKGKRIHVKPAVIGSGAIMIKTPAYHRKYPFGGYIPYRF